jgi:hypothetical protein
MKFAGQRIEQIQEMRIGAPRLEIAARHRDSRGFVGVIVEFSEGFMDCILQLIAPLLCFGIIVMTMAPSIATHANPAVVVVHRGSLPLARLLTANFMLPLFGLSRLVTGSFTGEFREAIEELVHLRQGRLVSLGQVRQDFVESRCRPGRLVPNALRQLL